MAKLNFDAEPFEAFPGFDERETARRTLPGRPNRTGMGRQRPPSPSVRPSGRPRRPVTVRLGGRSAFYGKPSPACVCPAHGTEFIRWVQSSLNLIQNVQLPIDGVMSPATRSALRRFQEQHGLPVDGIAGPETKRALMDAKRSQPVEDGEPPAQGEFEALELDEFEWEEEVNRSSSEYAKWVQSSLNKILGLKLAVDGIIGTQTRSAIRRFQSQKGLVVDGIVGSMTEQALIRAGAGSPPSSAGTPAQFPITSRPAPPTSSTGFLKDFPDLQTVNLSPSSPLAINSGWPIARRTIANIYNRLGGLMSAVARKMQVEVPAVLAVWKVESGNLSHYPGKAIIRFENHLLYRLWGKNNDATYAQHFRHGGYRGQSGNSWDNHQYREDPRQPFRPFHGNQDAEYQVFRLATRLAGEQIALQCISIGGPQILISNYSLIGYRTPREMYDAFQASERWQVLGFFDFCQQTAKEKGGLLPYLRAKDFRTFASYYNGSGQVDSYGGMIQEAYSEARQLSLEERESFLSELDNLDWQGEWEEEVNRNNLI